MRCPHNPHVICAYLETGDAKFYCLTCHRHGKDIHNTPATPVKDKLIKKFKLAIL